MDNIASIKSIEYAGASKMSLGFALPPGLPIDLNGKMDGADWVHLEISGNASLVHSIREANAGDIHVFTSDFKKAGIKPADTFLFRKFRNKKYVFRLEDIHDNFYLLGTNHLKTKFSYTINNASEPTGWRGYNCTITFETPFENIYLL